MQLNGEELYLLYDSKQWEKCVPRDKDGMLDAARVGTTSQIAEAVRQSHASTDYSTDTISVHIYLSGDSLGIGDSNTVIYR